ncbi:DUF779 domain-containing protein (plasmid) [Sphingobium sp. WTD-1]|uniref:DUF779 domain-containing protein n=1 Tax=Sphingobium sp. WTD-1 TaxID=2979467 RepID=UPI0024DE9BD3|nr:DUF779 domain-containing protein [Sphingobium sp. WTD-1]WIA59155.1 DUF779 domain-containing protein [Sphingobium sp. WTD-1]
MTHQSATHSIQATPAALALIAQIEEEHGELMFHQSGGCCDGSSPMCYRNGELRVGDGDVLLGTVGTAPFYIGKAQFEQWGRPQLLLDVVPGRGGMFSLDNGRQVRFHIRPKTKTQES